MPGPPGSPGEYPCLTGPHLNYTCRVPLAMKLTYLQVFALHLSGELSHDDPRVPMLGARAPISSRATSHLVQGCWMSGKKPHPTEQRKENQG